MLISCLPRIRTALLLAAILVVQGVAAQSDYPVKPARVIVPFAAGGAIDTIARPLGEAYLRTAGQPWVIENLGGAGGTIATAQVARAQPDGYQLLMASNGQISLAPFVHASLPYDPKTALVPVVHLADSSTVLYANSASTFRSLNDVLAAARSGAPVNFATAGPGSLAQLAAELLANEAKVKFTLIPYKGAGAALPDLASGQVPLLFTNVSTARPMVEAGKIRPLAVASEARLKSLPDVPTFAELGYPNVSVKLWVGLMAPKGTPQPIVDRLAKQVGDLLREPAFRARLEAQGWEVQGGDEASLRKVIDQDTARWRDLSKVVDLSAK